MKKLVSEGNDPIKLDRFEFPFHPPTSKPQMLPTILFGIFRTPAMKNCYSPSTVCNQQSTLGQLRGLGVVLFAIVAVVSGALAQSAGDYRTSTGLASGTWANGSPVGATTVWEKFDGSTWASTATPPSSSDGVITIRNGANVTVAAAVTADQVVVASGGTLTINGGTLTLADGTGTDLDVSGTLTFSAANQVNLSSGATVVVESSPALVSDGWTGTVAVGFHAFTGTGYTNGAGAYIAGAITVNGGYLMTRASGTVSTCTWNTGSLLTIQPTASAASMVIGGLNQTFYNVRVNCVNQTANMGNWGFTTINGDLTIDSTGFNTTGFANNCLLFNTTGGTLNLNGNVSINNVCKVYFFGSGPTAAATVNIGKNLTVASGSLLGVNTQQKTFQHNINFVGTTGGPYTITLPAMGIDSSNQGSGGTAGNYTVSGNYKLGANWRLGGTVNGSWVDTLTVGNGGTLDCGAFGVYNFSKLNAVGSGLGQQNTVTVASGGTLGVGAVDGIAVDPTTTVVVKSGTVSASASATLAGSSTAFNTQLAIGDVLYKSDGTLIGTITAIASATSLTLSAPVTVTAGTTFGLATKLTTGTGTITTTPLKSGFVATVGSSTTLNGANGSLFSTELVSGNQLYKSDGTLIGTLASTPGSATVATLTSAATVSFGTFAVGNPTAVTGSGTQFTSELKAGYGIYDANGTFIGTVASITSDTLLTLVSGSSVAVAAGNFKYSKGSVQVLGAQTYPYDANYTYDGTAAQVTGNGLPSNVQNLTVNNSAGVTLSRTTTIGNALYIQSGQFTPSSGNSSIAARLTFDGSTYQASGTWGNTGSGAANQDATHFAGSSTLTVFAPFVTSLSQFRSHISGSWNSSSTWDLSSDAGSTWYSYYTGFTPGSTPGSLHPVYIQSGHTVTVTENEACGDLHINSSSSVIALGANALSVNGKLRCYTGAVGGIPGTSSAAGFSVYPFTATTGGKVSIVGNSRNLTSSGEWSANITTPTTGLFPLEVNLNSGQTATNQTGIKATSCNIVAGTLDVGANTISIDNGTSGQGDVTVGASGTLASSASSAGSPVMQRTGSTLAGTLTVNGTLQLSGASPSIAMTVVTLNGTVEYSRAGAQTLWTTPSGTSQGSAAPLSSFANLKLSGSGAKTLGVNTTVNGTFTMAGTASLALNTFSLTYGVSSTLQYAGSGAQNTTSTEFPASGSLPANLKISNSSGVVLGGSRTITGTLTVDASANLDFNSQTLTVGGTSLSASGGLMMEVNKTAPNTFGGSRLTLSSGTFNLGGLLTVSLSSGSLQTGDSIPLFVSSGGFGGGFSPVTGPTTPTGLTRVATQLTSGTGGNITFTCDGTLIANAAADTTMYCGSSYSLNGSGSGGSGTYSTFAWTSTPSGFTSSSANPSVSPTGTTTYHLTVTDSVGCTATKDVVVTVNPLTGADKNYTRAAGASLMLMTSDLLVGANGVSVSYVNNSVTSGGQGATVTESGDHTAILYEPTNNNNDVLTFQLKDACNNTVTKNINITVSSSGAGGTAQGINPTSAGMEVTFAGIPGFLYDVERATDVNFTADLTTLTTTNAPGNGIFTITDGAPPSPTAYYRLKYNPN